MLRMLALVTGAAAALSSDAQPLHPAACEPIRVMTYNIHVSADLESEGKSRWSLRRSAVIGQIQAMRPAILGLQEVSSVQKADLRKTLPGYKLEGLSGETSVLAVDTSVFRVRSNGSFWLSPRPLERGKGWDAAYTRTANWAHLVRKRDGREVFALNTHLDNRGRRSQIESVRQILAWISDHRGPGEAIVLVGDMNSNPSSIPISELTSAPLGLRDAYVTTKTGPAGPEGTFNAGLAVQTRIFRIDYVFVDPTVEVASYSVLAPDDPTASVPSDHFPVVADIEACGK